MNMDMMSPASKHYSSTIAAVYTIGINVEISKGDVRRSIKLNSKKIFVRNINN